MLCQRVDHQYVKRSINWCITRLRRLVNNSATRGYSEEMIQRKVDKISRKLDDGLSSGNLQVRDIKWMCRETPSSDTFMIRCQGSMSYLIWPCFYYTKNRSFHYYKNSPSLQSGYMRETLNVDIGKHSHLAPTMMRMIMLTRTIPPCYLLHPS